MWLSASRACQVISQPSIICPNRRSFFARLQLAFTVPDELFGLFELLIDPRLFPSEANLQWQSSNLPEKHEAKLHERIQACFRLGS